MDAAQDSSEPIDPDRFREVAHAVEEQVARAVVGQEEAVRGVLTCVVLGAHALLEGIPGLGKTTLARAFAAAVGGSYSRIQFTPDLMPADITGAVTLVQAGRGDPRLSFEEGPVFAHLVLADEINRASPRTQSALLEAMQEQSVTIGRTTHELPRPFTVLATQNPVDLQGTYALPEAQLDRFLLKLEFGYPDYDELAAILARTIEHDDVVRREGVTNPAELMQMGALARSVPAASHVVELIVRLVRALQAADGADEQVRRYVRLGPSPRGAQALALTGRVHALLAGRHHLATEDVVAVALPALRHRLITTFEAERDGVTPDELVTSAVARVSVDVHA